MGSPVVLQVGSWRLIWGPDARLQDLTGPAPAGLAWDRALPGPTLRIGNRLMSGQGSLQDQGTDRVGFLFAFSVPGLPQPIRLRYQVTVAAATADRLVLRTSATVLDAPPGWEAAEILLPVPLAWQDEARFFVPLQSGRVARPPIGEGLGVGLTISGPFEPDPRRRLAIPVVGIDRYDQSGSITITWDPYTTGYLHLGAEGAPLGGDHLATPYWERLGMLRGEERSLWCVLQTGRIVDHLEILSHTALADIPPGPAWLHTIDLVGYDYWSREGRGWYEDLTTLAEWLSPDERERVAVTLHGWYGTLGRHAYDADAGDLSPGEWWVFAGCAEEPERRERFPACRPTRTSVADIRQRLAFAKERGFRCLLYFADGVNACTGAWGAVDGRRTRSGGRGTWDGPDVVGKPIQLNVVHPEVQAWFRGYLRALLHHFGDLIDGLVWDETYHVRVTDEGTAECPGYGARAMLRLCRDLAALCHQHRADLVFLTSDNIGTRPNGYGQPGEVTVERAYILDVPPYALVTDGCYQDSHCQPEAWPYGLLPNYRNVLWSCNWRPVGLFGWMRHGVEVFGVPAAFACGWVEHHVLREYPPAVQQALLTLFRQHRTARRVRWLEEG